MNDLRSRDRTLAPVRSIGPRTGEVVSNPRPRAVGNPLFQDSRYEAEAERAAERAADRLRAAARGEELVDDEADDGFSFPVTQELRHMPVSAARPPVEVVSPPEVQPEPEPEPAVTAEVTRATARRGGWAAAISGAGATTGAAAPPRAPASRPTKRREVVEETPEVDEERFPFHFSFKEADTDEPQELKAKSPLLARAFRSSVG